MYTTKRGHRVIFRQYGWFYSDGNPDDYSDEENREVWEEWIAWQNPR